MQLILHKKFMETTDKEVKKPSNKNVFQICNELRLVGVVRQHVLKKFKNDSMSKTDWKKLFKKERIDF